MSEIKEFNWPNYTLHLYDENGHKYTKDSDAVKVILDLQAKYDLSKAVLDLLTNEKNRQRIKYDSLKEKSEKLRDALEAYCESGICASDEADIRELLADFDQAKEEK